MDGAEDDPQGAAEVNVGGTAHAAELGAPLVAYSTDYVFDGRKGAPYVESDSPSPQSAYGMTKLHGEAAAGERAWVIRSSWLFGATGHNFVRTMLRLGAERDEVAVVSDQRGCPTYVGHLAAATRELVDARAAPSASGTSPPAATAPGPISPRPSSTRPASTAGCGGSRRPSSAPAPLARRSRSCAVRRTHPSFPTGARASATASPRSPPRAAEGSQRPGPGADHGPRANRNQLVTLCHKLPSAEAFAQRSRILVTLCHK